jgi:hypothetical protein
MMTREEMQEWLVERAEALVGELRKAGWKSPEQGKTQTSLAIEVARVAASPRLLVNWLRYQAARESRGARFWSLPLEGRMLAESVVADLKAIKGKLGSEGDLMSTITRYLGYFRRSLVGIEYLDRIRFD